MHKRHLKIISDIFRRHGIILSPKKIKIEKESIELRGTFLFGLFTVLKFLGIILDKSLRKRSILQKILKYERICGYNSGKFKPNELKWKIIEKELYNIKLALQKFQIFLAPEYFIIRTDDKAIRDFLVNTRKISGKRMQWYNEIAQYSFEIEHVKGKDNLSQIT